MKTRTRLIAIALAMVAAAPVAARDGQSRLERVAALADRQEQKEQRKEEHQDRVRTGDDRGERRNDPREEHRDDRQGRRDNHRDAQGNRENQNAREARHARRDSHEDRRRFSQDRGVVRQQALRHRQLYDQRLHERQRRWMTYRDHDRFFSTPFSQRYRFNDRYWNTNRYGMQMLREAANDGYAEGIRAGRADRYDHWRFDYRDSWAYRNPGYGYNGRYVDPRHYRHYFREGFRRGYEDGYYGRARYGRQDNGQYFMIATILAAILGT